MRHIRRKLVMALLLAFLATSAIAAGESDCRVGAYYYPWYGADFHGHAYMRELLDPPQLPSLGHYDDTDPDVIAQHIAWSRYAGIGFWSASWWGPDSREDKTLRDVILPHKDLGDLKIAIHYETIGRTKNYTDFDAAREDFAFLAKHYFDHPNYFSIEGKPVVFLYVTRDLAAEGVLDTALEQMRAGAGREIYLVGDHAFGSTFYLQADFGSLNAITNYDVYGSLGRKGYAGKQAVSNYAKQQSQWKKIARQQGVDFFPAVTPGFNDTGVRQGHAPLSRKIEEDAPYGSLFIELLKDARILQSGNAPSFIMITSWNEWHEDTQIEPVAAAAPTARDTSGSGDAYTGGLEHEGYDMRYLDILHDFCRD